MQLVIIQLKLLVAEILSSRERNHSVESICDSLLDAHSFSLERVQAQELLSPSQVGSTDLSCVLAGSGGFRVEIVAFVGVNAPDVDAAFDIGLVEGDFGDALGDKAVESVCKSGHVHFS